MKRIGSSLSLSQSDIGSTSLSPKVVKRLKRNAKKQAEAIRSSRSLSQSVIDIIDQVASGRDEDQQTTSKPSKPPIVSDDVHDDDGELCSSDYGIDNISGPVADILVKQRSDILALRNTVAELSDLLKTQGQTIVGLQHHVNTLLSLFSIDNSDLNDLNPDAGEHYQAANDNSREQASLSKTGESPTAGDTQDSSNNHNDMPTSYSQVVINNRKPLSTMENKFRNAILKTVYSDNQVKRSRDCTVIVSGLQSLPGTSDEVVAAELIHSEFGLSMEIGSAKRLGRSTDDTTTKPLQLTLKSPNNVTELLSLAKTLRRSSNEYVRQHVYINEFMTRAERQAAYEARRRRREKQAMNKPSPNVVAAAGDNRSTTGRPRTLYNSNLRKPQQPTSQNSNHQQ